LRYAKVPGTFKQKSAKCQARENEMPRPPRIYVKEALYFITCRGERAETLFKDEKDYAMFLDLMKKYQEQYGIKVFAYCFLPDHLHLLVEMEKPQAEVPESGKSQEISDFMRDLNNNYTKYYNSRFERKGHLFRERFKSALVEKDSHLLKMSAYIHVNPERVGLVKKAKEYPYSSFQTYLYTEKCSDGDLDSLRKSVCEALAMLGNTTYEQFVDKFSEDEGLLIHKKLQRGGVLGTEEFIRKVKAEVEAYQAKGLVEKSETNSPNGYRLYLLFGSLFLVLMVSASGIFLFFFRKEKAAQLPAFTVKTTIDTSEDLKSTEWEIALTAAHGVQSADTITFTDGKFVSANLNGLGFPATNYSLSIENDGRIIWETMQTSITGAVASWHGEIEHDKMRGIVSLRQEGKQPQDFSFTSVSYRRRK
jgi:putative transposase